MTLFFVYVPYDYSICDLMNFTIGGIWYGSSLWLVELETIFISSSCHFVWKFEWSCKEQVVCTKAYIWRCFQWKWNLILICAQDVRWKIAKAKDFSSLSYCVHIGELVRNWKRNENFQINVCWSSTLNNLLVQHIHRSLSQISKIEVKM